MELAAASLTFATRLSLAASRWTALFHVGEGVAGITVARPLHQVVHKGSNALGTVKRCSREALTIKASVTAEAPRQPASLATEPLAWYSGGAIKSDRIPKPDDRVFGSLHPVFSPELSCESIGAAAPEQLSSLGRQLSTDIPPTTPSRRGLNRCAVFGGAISQIRIRGLTISASTCSPVFSPELFCGSIGAAACSNIPTRKGAFHDIPPTTRHRGHAGAESRAEHAAVLRATDLAATTPREKIASGLLKPRSDGAFAVMELFCPRAGARYFQLAQAGNIFRRPCQESRDCSGGRAVAPWKWGLAKKGRGSIQRRHDAQASMKTCWARDCMSLCRSSRGAASSHSTRRAWSSVANCVSRSMAMVDGGIALS